MKHKIYCLLLLSLTSACGVELKDKDKDQPEVVQILAKPDYVIDGPVILRESEIIEVDRLVLTKNAVITMEDKNLTILAKEIVAEGAVIQNFTAEARAPWEKNGRSGGVVTIVAKKATGRLQIDLRGEGGGSGKHGVWTDPRVHPGCAGSSGGDGGNAGTLRIEIVDMGSFNINWQNQGGAMGPAGLRGYVSPDTPEAIQPPCGRDNPNGSDGAPGRTGEICLKLGNQEVFRCE